MVDKMKPRRMIDFEEDIVEKESALDKQVGGDHYRLLGPYQPWITASHWLTDEELRGAAKFTAITYLARRKHDTDEDVEKAMHTLQLYLEVSNARKSERGSEN